MPDLDESGAPATGTGSQALSRRSMLKGAAGAGAAGIAASALAGVAVPAVAATRTQLRTSRGGADEKADEAVVVHVRDAASGEIDVFRGTSQVRLHDRELAARLVSASR
jgi:hypothetical protein